MVQFLPCVFFVQYCNKWPSQKSSQFTRTLLRASTMSPSSSIDFSRDWQNTSIYQIFCSPSISLC